MRPQDGEKDIADIQSIPVIGLQCHFSLFKEWCCWCCL